MRAVVAQAIAMVTVAVLTGAAQAQQCLDAPNQKCLLEQALLVAESIKDDFWRDGTLADMVQALTKAGKIKKNQQELNALTRAATESGM